MPRFWFVLILPGVSFLWEPAAASPPASACSAAWRFADAAPERAKISVYQQALEWELPDHEVVATVFTTSPSGDWGQFVDYCFRPDGSLALTKSTLNTFAEGKAVRRIRERRFDANGHLLSTTRRLVAADTGQALNSAHFMDRDEPIYATRAGLPFAGLM